MLAVLKRSSQVLSRFWSLMTTTLELLEPFELDWRREED